MSFTDDYHECHTCHTVFPADGFGIHDEHGNWYCDQSCYIRDTKERYADTLTETETADREVEPWFAVLPSD